MSDKNPDRLLNLPPPWELLGKIDTLTARVEELEAARALVEAATGSKE